jgi:hypothetical protein
LEESKLSFANRQPPEKNVPKSVEENMQTATILSELARVMREQGRGDGRSMFPDEQAIRKQISIGAPFINVMNFNNAARPGTPVEVSSWIVNPSATTYYYDVFATLFFGVPGFADSPSVLLQLRDHRWPQFSSAPFTLRASEAGMTIRHRYVVPDVQPGTYHGSVILWREGYDVPNGEYFGRGFFSFDVLP